MHYEFRKNGTLSLTLRSDGDPIEEAFLKALFDGEIEIVKQSSANHPDEIVIKKKVPVATTV